MEPVHAFHGSLVLGAAALIFALGFWIIKAVVGHIVVVMGARKLRGRWGRNKVVAPPPPPDINDLEDIIRRGQAKLRKKSEKQP